MSLAIDVCRWLQLQPTRSSCGGWWRIRESPRGESGTACLREDLKSSTGLMFQVSSIHQSFTLRKHRGNRFPWRVWGKCFPPCILQSGYLWIKTVMLVMYVSMIIMYNKFHLYTSLLHWEHRGNRFPWRPEESGFPPVYYSLAIYKSIQWCWWYMLLWSPKTEKSKAEKSTIEYSRFE